MPSWSPQTTYRVVVSARVPCASVFWFLIWSLVCMSWAHQRVVQKRMNRSKCRCEEDCCTSVRTSCTTNAEVIELEHYGQMACGKPYAPIHDAWLYIRWDAYEIPAWRPCDLMSNYFDHMLYFVTTFTHTFNGPFSGWAGTRKVKPMWILLQSKRQWVAVASAGPYASLHLVPDR